MLRNDADGSAHMPRVLSGVGALAYLSTQWIPTPAEELTLRRLQLRVPVPAESGRSFSMPRLKQAFLKCQRASAKRHENAPQILVYLVLTTSF